MSFEWGTGDIIAISKLAAKVYTAYNDAPNDYNHIAEEVDSLQVMINKAAQYFTCSSLEENDRQEGQKILEGCQNLLGDLIENDNSSASASTSQVFQRVKLRTEGIATLRARLASNATLLSGFIQRFDISTMTAMGILC